VSVSERHIQPPGRCAMPNAAGFWVRTRMLGKLEVGG